MKKDVAVLMPVYNARKYLQAAIDSILSQSYRDFKLYIINDGSSDDSEKIILSYADDRIVYLKNDENRGLIYTLNKGFDCIDSEYLMRMDADDISHPERLRRQLEFMEAHPDVWVSGTQIQCFGHSDVLSAFPLTHAEIRASLLFSSVLCHPTTVMRIKKLKQHRLYYSADFLHIEDYELWTRIAAVGKLANLDMPLLNYRIEGQNISITSWDTREKRFKQVYAPLLENLGIPATEKRLDLHAMLAGNAMKITNLREVIDHSEYLLQQNSLKKVYDEAALKKAVKANREKLFYKLSTNGLPGVMRYFLYTRSVSAAQIRYLLGHYKHKLFSKKEHGV